MAATVYNTPDNKVSRENLVLLIRNNMLNPSVEFTPDADMETNSPIHKKTNLQPIIKKLFHSPISPKSPGQIPVNRRKVEEIKKRKRLEMLIPASDGPTIKMAYLKERDGHSPDVAAGMRKRVLKSVFHNKEYSLYIRD